MRMKIRTLAVLAIAVLLCGIAAADELEEGTRELQFDFSLVDSSAGSNVTIAGSLGWVLTTHHQAGPVISYSRDDPDGGAIQQSGVSWRTGSSSPKMDRIKALIRKGVEMHKASAAR